MTRDDMVALFSRRNDDWARRNASSLAADYAEDAVAESPMQGRIEGRDRIEEVFGNWFESFADITFTSRDVLIDGDRVAQFFALRGTQSAPFGGIPATGRKIDFKGAALFTFGPDGKITHELRVYDVTAVLVQLGVLRGRPLEET
jgi:steroid delta-isomerase-like uncharacterized protein